MSEVSYLDHLPIEVIENIAVHTSEKPRHKYWPSFIDKKTLNALINGNELLKSALTTQITSVSFLKSKYGDGLNYLLVRPRVEDGSFFIDSEFGVLYTRWFKLVRELSICYGATRSGSVLALLNTVGQNLRSMKKLQVLDKTEVRLLDDLLKEYGSQLEALSVWLFTSFSHATSIAENCNSLRELEITGLKHNVPELWAKLGKTLEKLCITFRRPVEPREVIEGIQQHCRKLKSISVAGGHYYLDDEILASFYCSYKDSLEYANFKELSPLACQRIVEECTNVLCSAGHRTEMVDQMKTLGSHIDELIVKPSPPESIDDFREGSERCENITIINGMELFGWSSNHIKAMFTKQRTTLKCFKWASSWPCVQGDQFFIEIIGTVARQTGNLREFSLSLDTKKRDIFDELAENNQLLENVHITFLGNENNETSTSEAVEILCGTVRSFKKCANMKEFRISHEGGVWHSNMFTTKVKEIENESVPYRTRRTYIRVGDIDYIA